MQFIQPLRRIALSVSRWALPLKFLVSAALGAVAGSSVLGFLLEYATYSYSLAYGFRPPVEGIPYLRAILTGASFALLVTGSALAAGILHLMRDRQGLAFKVSNTTHLVLGVFFLACLGVALVLWLSCRLFAPQQLCSALPLSLGSLPLGFLIGALLGAAAAAFAAWRPNLVWWFSLSAVAIYYLSVVGIMFSPSYYAALLRYTGFGGGLPVSLEVEPRRDRVSVEVRGHLMLRTSSTLVLFAADEARFHEYPLAGC